MKKFRYLAAALCAVVLLCGLTFPAFASGEAWTDVEPPDRRPVQTAEPTTEPTPAPTPEPTPTPTVEPTATPEPAPTVPATPAVTPAGTGGNKGGFGTLLLALAAVAVGGGAGWYFKIYRPKQQRAADLEDDYAGEPDYGDGDDYEDGPPWDTEGGE